MVETFERVAGEELGTTGTALYRQLHGPDDEDDSESADESSAVGDMLVFAYLLAIYADAGDDESVIGEGTIGIEVIVEDAFEQAHEDADETTAKVATLLNFLNVVGLPAQREQILSLGTVEGASFGAIKEGLSELEDVIHFGRSDGKYRLYHEFWSMLYLERLLKVEEREDAMRHFGASVNPLLGLWEDEDARAAINEELRREAIPEGLDEEALETLASAFVRGVAAMVEERSRLVELLGYGKYGVIEIPEVCSGDARAQFFLRTGDAFRRLGQFDRAEKQYKQVASLDDDSVPASRRAAASGSLGLLARSRGELEPARKSYEQSLNIHREIEDNHHIAVDLNNLGNVAQSRGELDDAEDYHQQSLETFREIGDRAGEAQSLNNLGNVAQSRGALDDAEEYYQQSLETFREIGDRAAEAQSLNNLGNVAQLRGALDDAEDYYEQSLEIKREIGDRAGEASSHGGLGTLARERGDLETAQEHFEQAAEILLEVGANRKALQALSGLTRTLQSSGLEDDARDACETGLALAQEIDVRVNEFRRLRAELSENDETRVEGFYGLALRAIADSEPEEAIRNLVDVWTERDEFDTDSDTFRHCLSAGTLLAAHLELFDFSDSPEDFPVSTDPDDHLIEIADHESKLPESIKPLFDHLYHGETDTTVEELQDSLPDEVPEENDEALEVVETVTTATLLSELT
jgi:tetratricopeptide (TPR) repeat protein